MIRLVQAFWKSLRRLTSKTTESTSSVRQPDQHTESQAALHDGPAVSLEQTESPKSIESDEKVAISSATSSLKKIDRFLNPSEGAVVSEPEVLGVARPPGETNKPPISVRKDVIDIWVGLDFGTSCTKVAYRRMDEIKKVYPILLDHGLRDYPGFAIPSLAFFRKDHQPEFGISAAKEIERGSDDAAIYGMKTVLAGEVDQNYCKQEHMDAFTGRLQGGWTVDTLAAGYIAHIMSLVKEQIVLKLRNQNIDLRFNVCVPIDYIVNNPVRKKFMQVVEVAHKVHSESKQGDIDWLKSQLDVWKESTDSSDKRAFIIPETVAQMASYYKSLEASNGIHALIDFGAGTTDLAIANRMWANVHESKSVWYAAKVLTTGTTNIENALFKCFPMIGGEADGKSRTRRATELLMRAKTDQKIADKICDALHRVWEDTRPIWSLAYSHLRRESEWRGEKVKILYSGGGANFPFVQKIFEKSWMSKPGQNWGPYPIELLPTPPEYKGQSKIAPFYRLSVAYGLTFPEPELGHIVLPKDAPDHTPPPLPKNDWVRLY
jgi:hypothetical protein